MEKRNRTLLTRLITVLFITLLLPQIAFSLQEDFSAYGQKETVNVCACSSEKYAITVTNNGLIGNNYFLSQDGSGEKYSTLSENAFFLEPGMTKEIIDYIQVPCGIKDEFDLNTRIITQFKKEKIIQQKINVQQCNNIQVQSESDLEQSVCAGKEVKFTFAVQNIGPYVETYSFATDRSDIATLSKQGTVLQPEELEIVTVIIDTQKQETLDITFFALAENNKYQVSANLEVKALACIESGVEIDVDKTNTINYGQNTIPIVIKNLAYDEKTYDLDIQGYSWTDIDTESLILGSGQSAKVNLVATPTQDTVLKGKYPIKINVIDEESGIQYSKETILKFSNILIWIVLIGMLAFILLILAIGLMPKKEYDEKEAEQESYAKANQEKQKKDYEDLKVDLARNAKPSYKYDDNTDVTIQVLKELKAHEIENIKGFDIKRPKAKDFEEIRKEQKQAKKEKKEEEQIIEEKDPHTTNIILAGILIALIILGIFGITYYMLTNEKQPPAPIDNITEEIIDPNTDTDTEIPVPPSQTDGSFVSLDLKGLNANKNTITISKQTLIPIKITNNLGSSEIFELSIDSQRDWSSIDRTKVGISNGASGTANIILDPQNDIITDSDFITLIVKATRNQKEEKENIIVKVNREGQAVIDDEQTPKEDNNQTSQEQKDKIKKMLIIFAIIIVLLVIIAIIYAFYLNFSSVYHNGFDNKDNKKEKELINEEKASIKNDQKALLKKINEDMKLLEEENKKLNTDRKRASEEEKIISELKQIKEEETVMTQKNLPWGKIIAIILLGILLIGLLGLGAWYLINNPITFGPDTPVQDDNATEQPQENPDDIITDSDQEIPEETAQEGNINLNLNGVEVDDDIIIINGNTKIPITYKNTDKDDIYSIDIQSKDDVSFVTSNVPRIGVRAGTEGTFELEMGPTEQTEEKEYTIELILTGKITGKKESKTITFEVEGIGEETQDNTTEEEQTEENTEEQSEDSEKQPINPIYYYIAGGILGLIIIAGTILLLIKRSKNKEEIETTQKADNNQKSSKNKKTEQEDKILKELKEEKRKEKKENKSAEMILEEPTSSSGSKRKTVYLFILIIVLLGLIGVGSYIAYNTYFTGTDDSIETDTLTDSLKIDDTNLQIEDDNIIIITNTPLTIPINIPAKEKKESYKVELNSDATWIVPEYTGTIGVRENEEGVLNVIISPEDNIGDGDYIATVKLTPKTSLESDLIIEFTVRLERNQAVDSDTEEPVAEEQEEPENVTDIAEEENNTNSENTNQDNTEESQDNTTEEEQAENNTEEQVEDSEKQPINPIYYYIAGGILGLIIITVITIFIIKKAKDKKKENKKEKKQKAEKAPLEDNNKNNSFKITAIILLIIILIGLIGTGIYVKYYNPAILDKYFGESENIEEQEDAVENTIETTEENTTNITDEENNTQSENIENSTDTINEDTIAENATEETEIYAKENLIDTESGNNLTITVTGGEFLSYPIKVTNNQDKIIQVSLQEGFMWINVLNNKTVILNPNQSYIFDLNVDTPIFGTDRDFYIKVSKKNIDGYIAFETKQILIRVLKK